MTQQDPPVELVHAAIAGEPGARNALVDAWLPVVLRWTTRMGGPKVDPEDAAHDVFIVVITRLEALKKPESFASWLFGITLRVLAKHRRRAWVRRWVPGIAPEGIDLAPGPARQTQMSETGFKVQQAMAQLTEKQRNVLILCELEQRTDVEAAELLGVPVGTAKSRLRAARIAFREAALDLGLGLSEVAPLREAGTWGQREQR